MPRPRLLVAAAALLQQRCASLAPKSIERRGALAALASMPPMNGAGQAGSLETIAGSSPIAGAQGSAGLLWKRSPPDSSPPSSDPLPVNPPSGAVTSPDTSAAPGTVKYEETASLASAATDASDRWLGGPGSIAARLGASAVAAGAGASSFLYSLWRDPSIAPYLAQTWGYTQQSFFPAGSGIPAG